MKKYLALALLFAIGPRPAFADPNVAFPTTADNAFLNGNLIVTLINHGSFSEEFRQGKKQVVLSDNVVEAGHIGSQYLFALDASVYQNPLKDHLDYEGALKLNLHAIVNKYVHLKPEWNSVVGNIEYFTKTGYDFGEDKAHKWFGSFNVGFGFGPGAGVQ